jgi:cobalamin biosynthesis Mg chelatase CobN
VQLFVASQLSVVLVTVTVYVVVTDGVGETEALALLEVKPVGFDVQA